MCQPSLHGFKSLTSKKSIYWLTCTHFHVEKVWITYSSLPLHSQWYWHSCSRDVAVKASQLWVVHTPCGPGFGRTRLLLPWERERNGLGRGRCHLDHDVNALGLPGVLPLSDLHFHLACLRSWGLGAKSRFTNSSTDSDWLCWTSDHRNA